MPAGRLAIPGMCFPEEEVPKQVAAGFLPFHTSVGEPGLCLVQPLVAADVPWLVGTSPPSRLAFASHTSA